MSDPTGHASSLADGEWHRLHPATPLLRGGIGVLVFLGIILNNFRERLIGFFVPQLNRYDGGDQPDPLDFVLQQHLVLQVLGGLAVVLALACLLFWLSWRTHSFRVTSEAVELRRGILFRTHRNARLDRIQGVNVARPWLARLFGAAKLDIGTAGQDANVDLAYLGSASADALRRDVLVLASGARQARQPVAAAAPPPPAAAARLDDAPAPALPVPGPRRGLVGDRFSEFLAPELDPDLAPPASIVRIPASRIVAAHFLDNGAIVFVLAVAAAVVGIATGILWIPVTVVPFILALGGRTITRILASLRYSIAGTADGIRVGYGLASVTNETIPPGRIHAIEVSQSLFWRPFGWWRIRINRAGLSVKQSQGTTSTNTLLPIGTDDDVRRVLALVLGDPEDADLPLAAGLRGTGARAGFTVSPRRARWLLPFSAGRNGVAVGGSVMALRQGVLIRRLILVPVVRIQSIRMTQGPIERALRLASVQPQTVYGVVGTELHGLDLDLALELFGAVERDLVERVGLEEEHWGRRMPTGGVA